MTRQRSTGRRNTMTRPRVRTRPVACVLVVGLALAGCGDDADATTTTTGTDEGTDEPDTAGQDATTGTGATVAIASDADLGDHLVDADGLTLYLFALDEGTNTACTGECAVLWPPLVAEDPVAGEGVDPGAISTAEGIEPNQVTYHGHLLYYYAADQAPGDIFGIDVPEWYAVDTAGNAIGTPEPASAPPGY